MSQDIKAIFGTRDVIKKVFKDEPRFGQTVDTGIGSIFGIPIFECGSDTEAFVLGHRYASDYGVVTAVLQGGTCLTIDGPAMKANREEMLADCLSPSRPEVPMFSPPESHFTAYIPKIVL